MRGGAGPIRAERGLDQLLRAGVSAITVLGDSCFAPVRDEVDQAATNFPLTWGDDAWLSATQILRRHKEPGIDVTFLIRAHAYVELDPLDVLQFHREQQQAVTRAFDVRLCDIVDNAQLLDSYAVDFAYLHSRGSIAGIWEGIATYLTIISEYVEAYRGDSVPLPSFVTASAKFRAEQVQFRRDFLRVPILPHSLKLYASEFKGLVLSGELRNSLRLSLLPCLATAAALGQKITGSDKGVW